MLHLSSSMLKDLKQYLQNGNSIKQWFVRYKLQWTQENEDKALADIQKLFNYTPPNKLEPITKVQLPVVEPPSLITKVKNLANTMVDVVETGIKTGNIISDTPIADKRIAICNDCPNFNKSNKTCNLCGCFMKTKVTLVAAKCPVNKW